MSATRKYVPCAGSTLKPTSVSCCSKNCLFLCRDAPRPLHEEKCFAHELYVFTRADGPGPCNQGLNNVPCM